ncbi:DNAJ heat shock family protein isoform X2 [Wolffia australiana]
MGRLRSLRDGFFSLGCCSRILSRASVFPAFTSDGLPAVDSKLQEGIQILVRAFSHRRIHPINCVRHQDFSRPGATFLTKRHFRATGVLLAGSDYYEILGVPRDASQDDIKKAFHALAKKFHPDANKHNPSAKRKFQELREAYETLRDKDKRAKYDTEFSSGTRQERYNFYSSSEFNSQSRGPFSDTFYNIFSEIFEDDRKASAADVQVELLLSFSEAAKGCTKSISFTAGVPCDSCSGRGHPKNAQLRVCTVCGGTGRVTVIPFTSRCSSCKGLGRIIKDHCNMCYGSGVVKQTKSVDVSIPAGVDSGDTIRVLKAGNSGGPGVQPGNLFIRLKVDKDPIFSRDGADIFVDSKISFTQAILGGTVEVPTLMGKTELKIPKGVQPGQLLVLRGRGLPQSLGLADRGDQYVRFCIHFPLSVSDRQKELLEEFAKEEEILERQEFETKWWHPLFYHRWDRHLLFFMAITILILVIQNLP